MTKGKKKDNLTIEKKMEQALVPREEWPYEVPENWCWVRLGSIVSVVTGKKDANYGTESGKYTFFTCAGEPINCDDYSFEGECLLLPGNGANVGKVFYFNGKFEAYQRTYVLQSKNKDLCLKYLYYQMQGFWEDFNKDKQYGSATNYIKMGNFTDYIFPLPPLPEQQRIVDRIESLFSKIDEAKEKAQETLDSFEERKASILHKAFSGELTEKWREDNGVSIDSWLSTKLSEIVDEFKYGLSEKSDHKNNGIPVLRIPNIDEGFLDFSDLKYLKSSTVDKESLLQQNDILIIRSNGSRDLVGKCALVPKLDKEFTYASFLIRIKTSEKIDADFLVKYLNSVDARSQMFAKAKSSSGIHNINSRELGIIKINVPTNKEQKEIVKIINYLLDKEESQKRVIEIVFSQIDTVKKSILAKAFRGELGTNYLEEEGAIEMLINGGKYK